MNYSQKQLLQKRLPGYTGFLILFIALFVTVLLSRGTVTSITKATVGSEPKHIHVSNITDTSFTLSYISDAKSIGSLAYGKDVLMTSIALDDRDKLAGKPIERQIHFITITNAAPATMYYYTILSGSQKRDDNGKPFTLITAPALSSLSYEQATVSGMVKIGDGVYPSEGIMFVTASNSSELASLILSDGSYRVPLSNLRTKTLDSAPLLQKSSVLQLDALTATQQSHAMVLMSQSSHVPFIVLAQDYDFTLNPEPIASSSGNIGMHTAFPVLETPQPVSSPEITTPTNAEKFQDQQPTFKGRALSHTEVAIVINSQQEIRTAIQSDDSGSWEFRPSVSLAPGSHTITIKSINASGILQTVTKSFTVYAEGGKFTEPSVSPFETPLSPTIKPTVPVPPKVLPSPTAAPSPTVAVTPTIIPQTPILQPTRGPLSPTGNSSIIIGIIGAVVSIGIGALLFFFTAI
jgi:hypothetical protein